MIRFVGSALVAFAALAWTMPAPGQGYDSQGGVRPYPLEKCRALSAALEGSVPISGAFSAGIEWFRAYDLGIKGRQCRIAAGGPPRVRARGPRPDLDTIERSVRAVLEREGWKGDEMLKRFEQTGPHARAFALRRDRATCWTNLEEEAPGADPGPYAKNGSAKRRLPLFYRLTVDCFEG